MRIKNSSILVIIIVSSIIISVNKVIAQIPSSSRQIIIVLVDSVNNSQGQLFLFEKDLTEEKWVQQNSIIPVAIGRNGLAWGIGKNIIPEDNQLPLKKEGDGRSPAGIFDLGPVFGIRSKSEIASLNMPYIQLTKEIECIDDIRSDYYNQIVKIDSSVKIDWNSSEKMSMSGIYYELGIVIEQNSNPVKKECGSCIFLHNWAKQGKTTAGCTAMDPQNLNRIINWLDNRLDPVIVQLPRKYYYKFHKVWNLPKVIL